MATEKKSQAVRYTGTSDVRAITVADWRAAGVTAEGAQRVSWDASNNWTVDRSALSFLSDEEFARMIQGDNTFRVE